MFKRRPETGRQECLFLCVCVCVRVCVRVCVSVCLSVRVRDRERSPGFLNVHKDYDSPVLTWCFHEAQIIEPEASDSNSKLCPGNAEQSQRLMTLTEITHCYGIVILSLVSVQHTLQRIHLRFVLIKLPPYVYTANEQTNVTWVDHPILQLHASQRSTQPGHTSPSLDHWSARICDVGSDFRRYTTILLGFNKNPFLLLLR